jgi:hypothetical protein
MHVMHKAHKINKQWEVASAYFTYENTKKNLLNLVLG